DDCTYYKNKKPWQNLQFPKTFGRSFLPEEDFIRSLDEKTGASLKLTILNPNGRVWNILSGGGASLIYLDEISKLVDVNEIANYGEYSGNPSVEESYQYAKTIIDLMTREENNKDKNKKQKTKILFIAGAIANFTDVEKTFSGIIKALEEFKKELQLNNVQIFVRRGGPNWKNGIRLIKEKGEQLNIKITTYGPNKPMVEIIPEAIRELKRYKQ
ncbi:MAG TPA: ATPase, partial [Dehalococcoidia bacterium]|nr:ATPase [Dehalococcoidia bacterium]